MTEEIRQTLASIRMELERMIADQQDEDMTNHRMIAESIAALEQKLVDETLMSGDEFLLHEMQDALQAFETEHPTLTDMVGRLSDLFSKIGI